MRSIVRRVQKLEQTTEKRHGGGICVIYPCTDEEAETQLAAYRETNGEPMTVLKVQLV